MEETKPKDITPIKRKGIDMAVKSLSKEFPFIKGYKDDTETLYQAFHYVDLFVDINELSQYMDKPIHPYWRKFVEENPHHEKVYAVWSYLMFDDDMLNDISNHPGYLLNQDIKSTLETMYQYLPEEYRLYYQSTTSIIDPPPFYPVHLKINAYYMT